jgi:hypothetical protein
MLGKPALNAEPVVLALSVGSRVRSLVAIRGDQSERFRRADFDESHAILSPGAIPSADTYR